MFSPCLCGCWVGWAWELAWACGHQQGESCRGCPHGVRAHREGSARATAERRRQNGTGKGQQRQQQHPDAGRACGSANDSRPVKSCLVCVGGEGLLWPRDAWAPGWGRTSCSSDWAGVDTHVPWGATDRRGGSKRTDSGGSCEAEIPGHKKKDVGGTRRIGERGWRSAARRTGDGGNGGKTTDNH